MLTNIDCYGRPQNHRKFMNGADIPVPYNVAATDGVIYQRFSADAKCAIIRICIVNAADGGQSIDYACAFGAWGDRATLAYQEINKPLLVDDSEVSSLYR